MNSIFKYKIYLFFIICFLGCHENKPPKLCTFNIIIDVAIPDDKKVDTKLSIDCYSDEIGLPARIRRRGGYSRSFHKRSYEIDLKDDIPLVNLPADDDWVLNANYIDKTFLRHVMSYELFRSMDVNNEASQCEYVEVAINGKYNGLYVLMEKLDKSSLSINSKDPEAMIFKEPHIFRVSFDDYAKVIPENLHQQTYPKIKKENKLATLLKIRDFILNSSDAKFEKEFKTIFDINNIIDWHLLLLITNNSDGILKNFYLYKVDKNTPIRIAPWDYDHALGRDGDNELNIDQVPMDIKRSILFRRLLKYDWYTSKLKKRWNELNQTNLFSVKGLNKRIKKKRDFVRPYVDKNFEVWPLESQWYYDANDYDQEIDVMLQFIEKRHRRVSTYFEEL